MLRPEHPFKVLQYNIEKGDSGTVVEMSLFQRALRSITGWIGKLNPVYKVVTQRRRSAISTDHDYGTGRRQWPRIGQAPTTPLQQGRPPLRTPQGETSVQAGQHVLPHEERSSRYVSRRARPGFLCQLAYLAVGEPYPCTQATTVRTRAARHRTHHPRWAAARASTADRPSDGTNAQKSCREAAGALRCCATATPKKSA